MFHSVLMAAMHSSILQTNPRKEVMKYYKRHQKKKKNPKHLAKAATKHCFKKEPHCVSNEFIGPREESYGTQGGESGWVNCRLFR